MFISVYMCADLTFVHIAFASQVDIKMSQRSSSFLLSNTPASNHTSSVINDATTTTKFTVKDQAVPYVAYKSVPQSQETVSTVSILSQLFNGPVSDDEEGMTSTINNNEAPVSKKDKDGVVATPEPVTLFQQTAVSDDEDNAKEGDAFRTEHISKAVAISDLDRSLDSECDDEDSDVGEGSQGDLRFRHSMFLQLYTLLS